MRSIHDGSGTEPRPAGDQPRTALHPNGRPRPPTPSPGRPPRPHPDVTPGSAPKGRTDRPAGRPRWKHVRAAASWPGRGRSVPASSRLPGLVAWTLPLFPPSLSVTRMSLHKFTRGTAHGGEDVRGRAETQPAGHRRVTSTVARGLPSQVWRCPEPDLNRYAREGQRGLSSPCLHSTIRAGHGLRMERPEPIGRHPSNCGRTVRCCLILLRSEGASAAGRGHPHLPIAFRATMGRVCGMTGFHRPEGGHHDQPVSADQPLSAPGGPRRALRGACHPQVGHRRAPSD